MALKIVALAGAERSQIEARFRQEVAFAMHLRGPSFVPLLDSGIRDEFAYIAMELLEGESLEDRLERAGRLSPTDSLGLLRGIAQGLQLAHGRGIVHRDLKPSNIFFSRRARRSDSDIGAPSPAATGSSGESVRILDFGVAKHLWAAAKITRKGAIVGTPHYLSPEQARGAPVDQRTDGWSLGVLLFRCLTGVRPFGDGSPSQIVLRIVRERHARASDMVPGFPTDVDRFFDRALAKRETDRFPDVPAMVSAFSRLIQQHFLRFERTTWRPPAPTPATPAPPEDESGVTSQWGPLALATSADADVETGRASDHTTVAPSSYEGHIAMAAADERVVRPGGEPTAARGPERLGAAQAQPLPAVLASVIPQHALDPDGAVAAAPSYVFWFAGGRLCCAMVRPDVPRALPPKSTTRRASVATTTWAFAAIVATALLTWTVALMLGYVHP